MSRTFRQGGLRFQYPESWQLDREESDDGWTVTVQSPDTAFFLLRCDGAMPDADEMAGAALEALRAEYPTLEAETRVETVDGQPAVGHDVRFFCLDLTNTCWTRSFYCDEGTVLLMCQFNDLEEERHEQALRAMCASLKVEEIPA